MGIKVKRRLVWTMVRSSFMMMGGPSHYPGGTKVEVLETKKVKGIEFFSFKTAKGTIRIAESISGGIILDSFDQLLDITGGCTKKYLLKQIAEGQPEQKIKLMSNEEFFKHYHF